MTDLEITRACADAMGLQPSPYGQDRLEIVTWHGPNGEHPIYHIYDPIHDDAQAMALVKKFGLECRPFSQGMRDLPDGGEMRHAKTGELLSTIPKFRELFWRVCYTGKPVENDDLNRAICECVAKIHKEKA